MIVQQQSKNVKFADAPIIPATALYRAAMVSSTRGNRVIKRLRRDGLIAPTETPTNRIQLSPRDGAVVFDALTRKD